MDTTQAIVDARQLTKRYKDFLAVDGIDFAIQPGECFGFLGPNGAGKTTTTRMIYGMIPPTSGQLMVFGLDITQDARQARYNIGVVPEESNLDVDLNVIENLEIYGSFFDIRVQDARSKAAELLKFVELEGRENAEIDALSNGMRRRLLLARALINDPKLLILDEPTTGLDPHIRHLFWDKLRSLRKAGMTQILTTHYMDEAAELCDRLIIMDYGKIVAHGSPQELVETHGEENLEGVFLKLTGRRFTD